MREIRATTPHKISLSFSTNLSTLLDRGGVGHANTFCFKKKKGQIFILLQIKLGSYMISLSPRGCPESA
jgi:hypothetical protein